MNFVLILFLKTVTRFYKFISLICSIQVLFKARSTKLMNIYAINKRYLETNKKSFIFLLQLFYKVFTERG